MTTLTRSNSRATTAAPSCYKDYMHFLGTYKNGKSENFALTNNDSSTSVNSDVTDFSKPAVSFNAYIENLKNKKFNTVDLNLESKENVDTRPDFSKSQSVSVPKNPQTEEKVSKKSEIFIEVQPTKPVSEVSKMFEKKQNKAPTKSTKMNSKINIFEKQISQEKPKLAEKPILPKIETEIQKCMPPRAPPINGPSSPPPPPPPTQNKVVSPRAQPINESSFPPPPPPLTQKVTLPRAQPISGTSSPPPPPPPTQNVMSPRAQPINGPSFPPPPPPLTQKITLPRAQPIDETPSPPSPPPPTQNVMSPRAQPINATSSPLLPPPLTQQLTNGSYSSSPPPIGQNGASLPPPPPPLPVMNAVPAKIQVCPPLMNTLPKMQATLVKGPQIKHVSVTNPNGVVPEEIDRNNPMVRKLVYGTLRGMVGAYHDKANDIMATLPKNMVKKSNGVQDIIEKIAQQSRLPGVGPGLDPSSGGIRAPPSPPVGHIPSVRLKSEIPDRRIMEPPPCVQNAMMKQDKKPFTYTPGGIDLSEIKSPRMARRIERNANYTGPPDSPRCTPQQPVGPIPPSTLAAMQPQMHVQVFPSGPPPPPPGPRGGPPPPPPPPCNIPPPPPPPTQPLPTQKIMTSENQVLERPDMTKIIPDNPMALLRKTGGPQPRNSLVDEMYNNQSMKTPPVQQPQIRSPPIQQQQRSPPIQAPSQRWAPQPPPVQQQQVRPPQQNHQAPPPPPVQQQWSPPPQPEPQRFQPSIPVIDRSQNQDEVKTSTAHLGSLYIPPINQQQRNVTSPPTPPKRDPQSPQLQSPSTPTLKEAPKPWQKQPKQQEELPPWAKKEPIAVVESVQQPPQQQTRYPEPQQPRYPEPQQPRYPEPQQSRFPPNRSPIQNNQRPPSPKTQSAPNAVYVTQPLVLQHPGPPPNRQQQMPRVDAQGAVIIPVQIEGARRTPTKPATPQTPGNERSLNRQQSWSNTPPQSNAFKVIQKITQTDGDDEDENSPVIEHGPRYPQQFQQTPPIEQMRKLKLSEGDRELMNRFRQEEEDPRYRGGFIPSRVFRILDASGVDDDTSLHNEVDPRYRGSAIPSKAFKLLQSMTDGSDSSTPGSPGATVSRGPPSGNRTPQVRTIPIQIERDDQPRNYVHPSEQTVPEPKKYTGSSIPSRSFKILQAMTAPDSCANANEVNENYDPSSYNQWGYDPNYPPPIPPYWPDYYYNYYYQNSKDGESDRDIRQTPVPFWGYYPPPSPYPFMQRPLRTPDIESDAETPRNTPLPFWGYYPTYYPPPTPSRELEEWGYSQENKEDQNNYAPPYQYPYWDPYYYYYGYPPMYSPYPFYEGNESEEVAGYSSTDEMAYFSKKFKNEREEVKDDRSSVTPKNISTPTLPQEFAPKKTEGGAETESERDSSESESETEVETEEEQIQPTRSQSSGGLQAIRSVKDIKIYEDNEDDNSSDDDQNADECSEETEETEDSVSYNTVGDEVIPHQLSVIYEESERSDSRRESSILSDSTTIADKSDVDDEEEEEENSATVSVKLPLKFKVEVTEDEEITTVIVGESQIKIEEEDDEDDGKETFASFTVKSSSLAPKQEKIETEAVICASDDDKPIPNVEPSNEEYKNDNVQEEEEKEEEEEEEQDWWGILGKEDDVMPVRPKVVPVIEHEQPIEEAVAPTEEAIARKESIEEAVTSTEEAIARKECIEETVASTEEAITRKESIEDDASSTSSSNSSSSKSTSASKKEELEEESSSESEEESESEDSESEDSSSEESDAKVETVENPEPLSIKDRIQALKDSINQKREKLKGESDINKMSVKQKISAIEAGTLQNNSKATSTKSSVKSFEEFSEEEGDSGVTSDMSRHISDNEEFPELKKMTRYQRAATHSRLFKLLQEVCEEEDEKEREEEMKKEAQLQLENSAKEEAAMRRDQLSLPLNNTSDESFSSSGITSPGSPVNEKLVTELVQSILKRKKGQVFRNLPKEKLQAAAKRILMEEFDDMSTPDSSFLSPLRNSTESSTPAQTPQEFYNDYKQYYDSWSNAERLCEENYDILPSKAFKLLQEHSGLNKTGAIAGLLAKCPKILTAKKLIETYSESPSSDKSLDLEPGEVTSAS